MLIQIIAVGKMKEPFYCAAQDEYHKRLRRYAHVSLTEVADEKLPPAGAENRTEQVRKLEGERLLKRLSPGGLFVALDSRGSSLDSETLAVWLGDKMNTGFSQISFLIGGTLGLPPFILEQAGFVWSLSRLTFPHQLARVIVLEQIYRAFKILRNEPYHH